MDITVVIPTHPARVANGMTERAVGSVLKQTRPASALIVEQDLTKSGAAETRHRGLQKVTTEWVAFLDSDDEFLPFHLEYLSKWAEETDADYLYPWFNCWGGIDPFPEVFGRSWDNDRPVATTITTMVRADLAKSVGFLNYHKPSKSKWAGEDDLFTKGCMAAGAKIVHVPEKTWIWNHHGGNTAGFSCHGDAVQMRRR